MEHNKSVFVLKIITLMIFLGLSNINCNNENSLLNASGAPPFTATFLPFEGSVRLVDPADPKATSITVETSGVSGGRIFYGGTFNSNTKTVSDYHRRTLIYGADDGTLRKINLLKERDTSEHHTQISKETRAIDSCSNFPVPDFSDHNKSQYVYAVPNKSGSCNTWKMIKADMSATDTPFSVQSPVTPIYDFSNGKIAGWLAKDGKNLNRYDENFASPKLIIEYTNNVYQRSIYSEYILLQIDNDLRVYNSITDTISEAIPVITQYLPVYNDGKNFFFKDGNSIYKLPIDGSSQSVMLVEEKGLNQNESINIDRFKLTENQIIYLWKKNTINPDDGTNTSTYGLNTIPKEGGDAVELIASTEDKLELKYTDKKKWIYYQYVIENNPDKSWFIAGVIRDDKSGQKQFDNAKWIGTTSSFSYNLSSRKTDTKRIFLAIETDPDTGSLSNSTIESYNIESLKKIAIPGTLPSDIFTTSIHGTGYHLLFGGNGDIFYINSELDNSLIRVTTTPNKNEVIF